MKSNRATQEPPWVRYTLLTIGLGFLFFFLGLPLLAVFAEALAQGVPLYLEALKEPETRSAIGLTVGIALAVHGSGQWTWTDVTAQGSARV